jgi:hypothetical protein
MLANLTTLLLVSLAAVVSAAPSSLQFPMINNNINKLSKENHDPILWPPGCIRVPGDNPACYNGDPKKNIFVIENMDLESNPPDP